MLGREESEGSPDFQQKVGDAPTENAQDTIALIDRGRIVKAISGGIADIAGQKASLIVVIPGGAEDCLHLIKTRMTKFELKKSSITFSLPDADEYLKDAIDQGLKGEAFTKDICDRIQKVVDENRELLPEKGYVLTSITIGRTEWLRVVHQIKPLIDALRLMEIGPDLTFVLMMCLAGKPELSANDNCEIRNFAKELKSNLANIDPKLNDKSIIVTDATRNISGGDIRTWAGQLSITYNRPYLASRFENIAYQIQQDVPLGRIYKSISDEIQASWK